MVIHSSTGNVLLDLTLVIRRLESVAFDRTPGWRPPVKNYAYAPALDRTTWNREQVCHELSGNSRSPEREKERERERERPGA